MNRLAPEIHRQKTATMKIKINTPLSSARTTLWLFPETKLIATSSAKDANMKMVGFVGFS